MINPTNEDANKLHDSNCCALSALHLSQTSNAILTTHKTHSKATKAGLSFKRHWVGLTSVLFMKLMSVISVNIHYFVMNHLYMNYK